MTKLAGFLTSLYLFPMQFAMLYAAFLMLIELRSVFPYSNRIGGNRIEPSLGTKLLLVVLFPLFLVCGAIALIQSRLPI